jgi:hypothetical protein
MDDYDKKNLIEQQKEWGCPSCHFVDKQAVGKGKACCTYGSRIQFNENGLKCLTRKEEEGK